MKSSDHLFRKLGFRFVNWISRYFFASRLSFSHIEAFVYFNSWKKFTNLIHAHWDKFRGKTLVSSKPYLFVLEPTNICNLKCPFCLTGKGVSGGRRVRHLSFEEAKNILDEIGDYIYLLQLYTWGEPLLNKDLVDIIAYAASKKIYVMLSTNATTMTPDKSRALIESGVNYVMVAIDGGTRESYSKYRVGGDFEKVLSNVKSLVELRDHEQTGSPFIEWQFVVFRHNEHEVEKTEKMAYEMGINKFTPLPAYVEDADWLPIGEKYKPEPFNPERINNCNRPWTHLNVRADGGIAPCCYGFFKRDDFAELGHDGFAKIWNNSKFKLARKMIIQKREGKEIDKSPIICHDCLSSGRRPSFVSDPEEPESNE